MKIRYPLCLLMLACVLGCANTNSANSNNVTPAFGSANSTAIPFNTNDFDITYQVAAKSKTLPAYNRTINLRAKVPVELVLSSDPTLQAPIVIFSHGGGKGLVDGHKDVSQQWTDELASQGFITINIGHGPPTTNAHRLSVCDKVSVANAVNPVLKFPADPHVFNNTELPGEQHEVVHKGNCDYFQSVQYLRFRDVRAVLNRLETTIADKMSVLPDHWSGKLVHMGHSAGSAAVMTFAGATRTFIEEGNTRVIADTDLFDAYIALSPQSAKANPPYTNGFAENAWTDVDQPILMVSGVMDDTDNQLAVDRIMPYDNMNAGAANKYWMWFTSDASGHSELNLKKDKNPAYLDAEFDLQSDVLKRTVLRFLDIYARDQTTLTLDTNYVKWGDTNSFYIDVDFDTK